jgi:hypothetical protein
MDALPYDKIITVIFLSLWFIFPAGLFISFLLQHSNERVNDGISKDSTVFINPVIESQADAENRIDHYEEDRYREDFEKEAYDEYPYQPHSGHYTRSQGSDTYSQQ